MFRHERLEGAIKELQGLNLATLRKRWGECFGIAPAPRISRDVLIRGVAYGLQEEELGGLKKSARRRMARLAVDLRESGTVAVAQGTTFKPGTRLIREWKGKVHEVVICDGGYIWSGKHYRSLSQIARSITGTRWSGPRFFGLETGQQRCVNVIKNVIPGNDMAGITGARDSHG